MGEIIKFIFWITFGLIFAILYVFLKMLGIG
jgi:hypothetical protein